MMPKDTNADVKTRAVTPPSVVVANHTSFSRRPSFNIVAWPPAFSAPPPLRAVKEAVLITRIKHYRLK